MADAKDSNPPIHPHLFEAKRQALYGDELVQFEENDILA